MVYQKLLKTLKWQVLLLFLGLISICLYFVLKIFSPSYQNTPLLLVIYTGSIPLIGQIILKLFQRNFGADILAAISIIAAFILGEYLACVLVIMMIAGGQYLETYALNKASSVLKELADRIPQVAKIKRNTHIDEIDISEINIGDHILIAPHEACPADGIVLEGHGFMDESYLTGEPFGVAKAPGASVLSGSINSDTALLIQITKKAKDSRYAKIIQVIDQAEQRRPKIRRLADKLGTIFAPISLLLAIGAWAYSAEPIRFLSVLVIATPCPLLIAIPVAIISSISLAARKGIIITDSTVLEMLPKCRTAIFDKTGTLTFGKAVLTSIKLGKGFKEDEVLQSAASLEQYSKHPLSKAVLESARKARIPLKEVSNVSELPGQGLFGIINNYKILITGREKLAKSHPKLINSLPRSESGLECIILFNDQYAATLSFHDEPKPDSIPFISHLAPHHGFDDIMLVSGDRESEVTYFAKNVGISKIFSSQSPEQKVEIVVEATKNTHTVFMGDGINDAPALRAATVGIAFGEPTAVTRESAGAVIMENTLLKVDELFHLSIEFRKVALQSALGGMTLSFVGMGFAFFGLLSPIAGALLQQLIDAGAIINVLRITWKKNIKVDINR